MSSNFYTAGLNHVGSYQVSGKPYLSGSNMPGDTTSSLRFQFSSVSKSITVKSNFGHAIRVHFAPYTAGQHGYTKGADNNDNFTTIAANGSQIFDVKCKEIFISSTHASAGSTNDDVQIFAELTTIPAARMYSLDNVVGVAT